MNQSSRDSEGESSSQNLMLKVIKIIYPCTFCGSNSHCVEDCWKHKSFSKKVGAIKIQPQKDGVALQVKNHLGKTLPQSDNDSTTTRQNSGKSNKKAASTNYEERVCQNCKLKGNSQNKCLKLPQETTPTSIEQETSKAPRAKECKSPDWKWVNFMPYA